MNLNDMKKDVAREICRMLEVNLSPDHMRAFADILEPFELKKGRDLLKEGDVCNHMFYVLKGLVLQHYRKNDISVVEHISSEHGIVVCIESYFKKEPSRIVITALEPSVLFGIPREALRRLATHSFDFCDMIFKIYSQSLIISQRKADVLRFESAKERYLRTLKETPEIIRRAPLYYVASFLQMTPETLSRVRTQVSEEQRGK